MIVSGIRRIEIVPLKGCEPQSIEFIMQIADGQWLDVKHPDGRRVEPRIKVRLYVMNAEICFDADVNLETDFPKGDYEDPTDPESYRLVFVSGQFVSEIIPVLYAKMRQPLEVGALT